MSRHDRNRTHSHDHHDESREHDDDEHRGVFGSVYHDDEHHDVFGYGYHDDESSDSHHTLNETFTVPSFQFTFSADKTKVLTFTATDYYGRVTSLDTTGLTPTVGVNDLGQTGVTAVTRNYSDANITRTTIWSDKDGDGFYAQSLDTQVAKVDFDAGGAVTWRSDARLEKHKFTFDAGGAVVSDQEQVRSHFSDISTNTWRSETLEANEVYSKVTVGTSTYVVKTEARGSVMTPIYRFEVLVDGNGDGIWTEVAHGAVNSTYVAAATGALDLSLSGLTTQLAASGVIG